MSGAPGRRSIRVMTRTPTPRDEATAVLDDPALTPGDDERFVGAVGPMLGAGHADEAGGQRFARRLAARGPRRGGPAPEPKPFACDRTAGIAALVRRAGHVHVLGRIGISNQICSKAGPLTVAEAVLQAVGRPCWAKIGVAGALAQLSRASGGHVAARTRLHTLTH